MLGLTATKLVEKKKFDESKNELEVTTVVISEEVPAPKNYCIRFGVAVMCLVLGTLALIATCVTAAVFENYWSLCGIPLSILYFIFANSIWKSCDRIEEEYLEKTQPLQKELLDIELANIDEEFKAMVWRHEHPLEEVCRLALTKNPNYVADLIRYIKKT